MDTKTTPTGGGRAAIIRDAAAMDTGRLRGIHRADHRARFRTLRRRFDPNTAWIARDHTAPGHWLATSS